MKSYVKKHFRGRHKLSVAFATFKLSYKSSSWFLPLRSDSNLSPMQFFNFRTEYLSIQKPK